MVDEYPNLIRINTRPHEEQIEISRKGGIASGKARRAKSEEIRQKRIEMIAQIQAIRYCCKDIKAQARQYR